MTQFYHFLELSGFFEKYPDCVLVHDSILINCEESKTVECKQLFESLTDKFIDIVEASLA
jgi:hypothetical protein